MSDMFNHLAAPFDPDDIKFRVGATNAKWLKEGDQAKGIALAYVDARVVMDRLDEVCGPENWQCRYPHASGKTCCEIGIRLFGPVLQNKDGAIAERMPSEWVWKADGAGDTDHEGEKGAFSDSFKRAAVRFGIGRYLYDAENRWWPVKQRGNSWAFEKATEQQIRNAFRGWQALKPTTDDTLPLTKEDILTIETELSGAATEAQCHAVYRKWSLMIKASPKDVADEVIKMMSERKTDILAAREQHGDEAERAALREA